MAITHKRQDDLESMFASFAKVPKPKKVDSDSKPEQKYDSQKD